MDLASLAMEAAARDTSRKPAKFRGQHRLEVPVSIV
jgi:hypothetical protein